MAISFAKECENIIAEIMEIGKALVKAQAAEAEVADAHKEASAKSRDLEVRFDELKAALHSRVDAQVAKSK